MHATSDHINNGHSVVVEAIKSAPPVAATGAFFLGVHLHDWMVILTIIWLACQIGGWVWDRFFKESTK